MVLIELHSASNLPLSRENPESLPPETDAKGLAKGRVLALVGSETLFAPSSHRSKVFGRTAGRLQLTNVFTLRRLSGRGHEVDIGISTRALDFAPTFLHKSSTKTFRLQNRSAIKAPFSFKSLPSAETEAGARARALADLAAQEARERELLIRDDVSDGAESAGSDSEDEDRVLGSAHLALAKKYRALRAAAAADSGGFRSDIFAVSPAEGEIWPHGEVEVSVTFFPADPLQYQATAYCDVAGRAERIPVDFRGLGKGPRVLFTYESLDVGDVFVNSVRMYEVRSAERPELLSDLERVS